MPIVQTGDISPDSNFSSHDNLQIYNGLDCCVTTEVFEEIEKLRPSLPRIYDFERAIQAPYLEIMLRGFKVDQIARRQAAEGLRIRLDKLDGILHRLAMSVWGKGLNPRSPAQLKDFFYSKAGLGLPEVWLRKKGEKKLSTDREALEKLDDYMHARPFVQSILLMRDIGKQLSVFESEIDPDGRFRTSYNIAGTETGRPSSSTSSFGTGGNAQNIAPGLRYVFTADAGYKLCVIDLEQVEARDVGWFCGCLFDDWSFLDACESGDLHTENAKRIWRELPWVEGDKAQNRKIADAIFYRDFTYRDMAKRGSHLSNYSGTAYTASRSLKVPQALMEEFQARYCRGRLGSSGKPSITPAFPCIPRWWQWTATQLQTSHKLITPFGRERHFFGRPGDDTTLREAIAFLPQSTTGDRMNLGMWKVWRRERGVQLLAQTFDSITFQVKEGPEFDDTIGRVLEHLQSVVLSHPNGRKYWVPAEAKVGWNWGYFDPKTNPEGLMKWKPGSDIRVRRTGLQRIMGA